MSETQEWSQFHNVLGLRSFTRRMDILRRQYLNHRFDRKSPLPLLPEASLARIYGVEVTFPPRSLLMQPGTQTIDGLFFITSLAASLKASTVFEIGTYVGLTTWTLALNLPEGVIYTLDIPPNQDPKLALDKDDVHRASEERLLYRGMTEGAKIEQLWGDSATFDFSPWHHKIDLVYVDGAHSVPYVLSDTEQALKMVSPKGAVVWDDYWRLSPGVATVLNEQTDLPLYRVPGTRLVAFFNSELPGEPP